MAAPAEPVRAADYRRETTVRQRRGPVVGLSAVVVALVGVALAPNAQARVEPTTHARTVFHDNFRSGFDTENTWSLLPVDSPAGALPEGDGIITTSRHGLTVVPTGTNPHTGLPAYAATTGQQSAGGGGSADHIKWLAFPQDVASSGQPGFDVPDTGALTCTTTMAAIGLGVNEQPFGDLVPSPNSDPRLTSGSMITADFETSAIADFSVTNTRIYAVYERLRQPGTTYAAYSYVIPVARRLPWERDTLQIRYDQGGTRVTWLINGRRVLSTDRIGSRAFDRRYLVIDHGGAEEPVDLRQVTCGIGTGTQMDGAGPDGRGLVRIDSTPGFYFDPSRGEPVPQTFVDEHSLASNRLWGQGEIMSVGRVDITVS